MKWFTPYCVLLLAYMSPFVCVDAQETLPQFKVKDLGKQGVQISWLNPFKNCQQLSVQRSTDSIQFKTILHAQTPNMYENGFIDKAPTERPLFYRIYYVLAGGKFYFSTIQSTQQNLTVNSRPAVTWKASTYVFCNGKGTPTVLIPTARKHLYRLVFKEEDGTTVFEINPIKDPEMYLDKANFVHTGWFLFDLFEDGQLKEQGKILIQKDAASR